MNRFPAPSFETYETSQMDTTPEPDAPEPRYLECWRCLRPITDGRYNLDEQGPSHKDGCP